MKMNKKCQKCNITKNVQFFGKNKSKKDGLGNQCRVCCAEYQKLHRKTVEGKEYERKRNESPERIKYKKEYIRQYHLNRRKKDPVYKLLSNIRSMFVKVLCGNWKCGKTVELLGCNSKQLRQHIEIRFVEGMTWDNQGQWHIDHIKPCSLFDFSKVEEQRKCFHYSNLQPLWAKDNIRKSNKY